MAISFPSSPSTGQTFTHQNKVWTWDGNSWKGGVSSGGDAGTLDSLNSTQFLRSDATDGTTGSLGIGMTSPQRKLHIVENSTQLRINRTDGTDDTWEFYSWNDGLNIYPVDGASTVWFGRDGQNTDVSLHNGRLAVNYTGGVPSGYAIYANGSIWAKAGAGDSGGLRLHSNSGINVSGNAMGFHTGQTNGFSFNGNSDGADNNNQLVVIKGNGNVGIGETNPSAMLEFGSNTTDNRYDIKAPADNARGIGLGNYTTFSTRYSNWDTLIGTNIRSKIGTSSSGEETASSYTASGGAGLRVGFQDLEFKNYSPAELSGLATGSDVNSLGTTRFKIDASGNVGIGATSPWAKMQVQITDAGGPGSGTAAGMWLRNGSGTAGQAFNMFWGNSQSAAAGSIALVVDNNTNNYGSIQFQTRTSSGGYGTKLAIDSNGNVEISSGQLKLANITSNPSSPVTGGMYFNTTSGVAYVYNGTGWDQISNVPMSATGGTESTYASYKVHVFTSSSTFNVSGSGATVDYMIIAGGGGGGALGGGGGAGGMITGTASVQPGSYTITVGGGGNNGGPNSTGGTGGNSSAFSVTANGGGGGGSHSGGSNSTAGTSGGSGGGGSDNSNSFGPGSGTAGQGNQGGNGCPTFSNSLRGGGGGGGKGNPGLHYNTLVSSKYGNGGAGAGNNLINGTTQYFAGGGGRAAYGGSNNHAGDGGIGGGGGGSSSNGSGNGGTGGTGYNNGGNGSANTSSAAGGNGGANTGGGAGCNSWSRSGGAAGGSGIVVIRYTV